MSTSENSRPIKKIKAYAILAGGGVKGAALVGALRGAEKYGIEFVGYGGASAGSVVALLASLGYSTEEMKDIVLKKDFSEFLDDASGKQLDRVRQVGFKRILFKSWCAPRDGFLLNRIRRRLGLYKGHNLEDFLREKIVEKYHGFKDQESITFKDLEDADCKALKVIASDVSQKKALRYSAARRDINESVLRAVRASISFPFVFEPVPLKTTNHRRYIVDGGLISNLPVFLFAREQRRTGYHVFAFDLIPPAKKRKETYRFRDFCSDLVATALEAGDNLHRETISDFISNLVYIPIPVPEGIDTLKFSLSKEERKKLYRIGLITTWRTLRKKLPELPRAATRMQSVQATLNIPVSHVQSLLKALAQEINDIAPVSNLRTHIILPVSERELMVTYHFNMDHDTDRDIIVGTDSKWARQVFLKGKPTLSDLEQLRAHPEEWRLSDEVVKQIDPKQNTLFSVPIREQRRRDHEREQGRREPETDEGDCIGVLSVDTATPLGVTMWRSEDRALLILEAMMKWAKIVSRVIS